MLVSFWSMDWLLFPEASYRPDTLEIV